MKEFNFEIEITNLNELKKLLELAKNQNEQLTTTLKQIQDFKIRVV